MLRWCRLQENPTKFPLFKCTEVVPKFVYLSGHLTACNAHSRPNIAVAPIIDGVASGSVLSTWLELNVWSGLHLRHAKFAGLRFDKEARSVTKEHARET
jgi:hypothetical protein